MQVKRCLCGGSPILFHETQIKYFAPLGLYYTRSEFYVSCPNCEAITYVHDKKREAIKEWNKEN